MIRKHWLTSLTILAVMILSACGANTSPTANQGNEVEQQPAALTEADKQHFDEYTQNLRGAPFIKEATIVNDNRAEILYFKDFAELQAAKPDTKFTEADFNGYWESGDAVNKALMEESTRLFREFPALASVQVSLPFQGKTYYVDVTKQEIEDYFDVNFADLHEDETLDKWKSEVAEQYFTEEERGKYAEKFIKVQ